MSVVAYVSRRSSVCSQSLIVLVTFLRTLYYFRGWLRLGALIHTMLRIFYDIFPLMIMLLLVTSGFAFSLMVLVRIEVSPRPRCQPCNASFVT